jgi:adenylosuccinate synthase
MPYHKMMDELEEKLKGGLSAGTTKRGIGPCYADKSSRFGIRMGDLLDRKHLEEKLSIVLPIKEKFLKAHAVESTFNRDEIIEKYIGFGNSMKPMITDTSVLINNALAEGKNVLLEGAQGTLLDVDHGVYPFGTSSNPIAGGACTGAGIGPTKISAVIGIVKAYTSRVGEGPFPTELKNDIANHLREKGGEYGTTTGRPRRVGWLDMVMIKYAVRLNGITSLAVTKLDIMGGIKDVKVSKQYSYEGAIVKDFPANIRLLAECTPVYDQFDGWETYTREQWQEFIKKGYHKFPENLVKYIEYIEKESGVPVEIISLGQDRDLTLRLPPKNGKYNGKPKTV